MKKILFAILSILTLSLSAQNKYATTTDGKTVLLKSNGTWEYVKDKYTSSNINQFKSTSSSPSPRRTNSSKSSSSSRNYIRGPRDCHISMLIKHPILRKNSPWLYRSDFLGVYPLSL